LGLACFSLSKRSVGVGIRRSEFSVVWLPSVHPRLFSRKDVDCMVWLTREATIQRAIETEGKIHSARAYSTRQAEGTACVHRARTTGNRRGSGCALCLILLF